MKRPWLLTVVIFFCAALLAVVSIFVWNPTYLPTRAAKLYLYSAGIREQELMVDGHRIAYFVSPKKKNAPEYPLVLVHGLGATKMDWAAMMVPLARAGFHVYALDLLGYGNSSAPRDGDYSIVNESHIVYDFMQQLKIPQADVAGWSMGGWVAMTLTLDHPEAVRRLVVLDSAGIYFPLQVEEGFFTPQSEGQLQTLVQTLEPDKPFIRIPKWAAGGILRQGRSKQWVIRRSFANMMRGRDLLDFRLGDLKQPTLIVWGTEDKLIPFETGKRLWTLIPNSSLVGVRGCGHLAPGECWSQITPEVIGFLKSKNVPPAYSKTLAGPERY